MLGGRQGNNGTYISRPQKEKKTIKKE